MPSYMDKLHHKRGSVREEGLMEVIKHFQSDIRIEFAEKNYFTILTQCAKSIKNGSASEIKLAAHAIGLLALTVGPGDCANEIYSESLSILPKALTSKPQPIAILECLAIVTFVRDNDFDETERSMKIIWEYINKKLLAKDAAHVVAVAIYAWSFLLARADHCRLNRKYWKGVIPFFMRLLKNEDSVYNDRTDEAPYIQVLEDAGMRFVESAVGSTSDASELSTNYMCRQTLNIGVNVFTLDTWSEQKKMNYLKRYLGDGFKKHIVDNYFLHNAFKSTIKELDGPNLYVSEEKEVTAEVYIPGDRDIQNHKRLVSNSCNSILSKGKTKFRNKLRKISQEKKTGGIHEDDQSKEDELD